ncbi:unnamed protein product [Brassicogethes aeneus]|uniref:Uncharacterized protein n=1 Tax=Brassicogethes aeneus TaxID=1431903 RepID=A0A9P0B387_BRAAE|nr:unnamed protein product [Brassicogethes aeneus]
MFYNEETQTDISLAQKALNNKVVKEGMDLWKKQKDFAKVKKIKEQQEMRDMLERYWPWSGASNIKPRGYKNLRLEELYPNNDYQNAKRFVGVLEWGKPGGGAPMSNTIKTREDPLLRFQFGKDLRKSVDNNLRYKTNKTDQQIYKKQLDQLVEEKKIRQIQEKLNVENITRKQGWSTQPTLAALQEKNTNKKDIKPNNCEAKDSSFQFSKPVNVDYSNYQKVNFARKNRKLSPLSHKKDNGVELVTLLAKDRKFPPKIPLTTTDITSEKKLGKETIWNREGSAYLKELTNQMNFKRQKLKEIRAQENENVQRHFSTWEKFWGRPGNGAPLPEIKKQCLDQLLYPKFMPISTRIGIAA